MTTVGKLFTTFTNIVGDNLEKMSYAGRNVFDIFIFEERIIH